MEKRIYLVRHCEAAGQAIQSPLTRTGFRQAESLIDFFSNVRIDKIIASPFLRAVQTIEPLSEKSNMEIELDQRLSERRLSSVNLPDWMGKLKKTFEDMELSYEGGESSREATERIVSVLDDVLQGPDENIFVVTHGNLLSLLIRYFDRRFGYEQWKNLSNPDVYLLQYSNRKSQIDHIWQEK